MSPVSRKIRPPRSFVWLLLLSAAALAAGCSDANTSGGGGTSPNHVLPSGSSVPGWTVPAGGSQHAIAATNEYSSTGAVASCTDCHGPDLRGGISGASCFGNAAGCHHGTIAGWTAAAPAAQQHGVWAKRAIGDGSFYSCQICHGRDFSGGGSLTPCSDCHAPPHPPAPWRGAGYTHANADPSNAPVCAQCHFPGSPNNPAGHPATPAPAGTPPGCFNSTLCHGQAAAVPHPLGNPAWTATPPAPQPHGIDAKAAPDGSTGFAYCQVCHGTGTDFAGGTSGTSCYPCHLPTANSPHPSQWRTGDTYVHTTAAEGNAPVCAFCHAGGVNSPLPPPPAPPPGTPPGCSNNTLCHGVGVHPAGWAQSTQHGPAAKAAPSASGGFASCQTCHGTGTTPPANFGGVPPAVSCYPCHGVTAPHPAGATWVGGGTPSHRTTNSGNAPVCQQCHFPGSPSNPPNHPPAPPAPGAPPDCFNNTLCH